MSWVKRNSLRITTIAVFMACMLFSNTTVLAQVWGPLGNGVKGNPVAYATQGKGLYILVDQGINDDNKLFSLQMWNGLFWTQISRFEADKNAHIFNMVFYKGRLYLSGQFSNVKSVSNAKNLIAWDFKEKEFVSIAGLDRTTKDFFRINDMVVYKGYLVVGGLIARSTSVEVKGLQVFNGTQWVAFNSKKIGTGFNGEVDDLLVKNDTLFVAGKFEKVNGTPSKYIFALTGTDAKFYNFNTIKPSKIGIHDGKVFCASNIGGQFYLYYLNEKWFDDKFSKDIAIYGLRDIVEHNEELWLTGSIGIEIDSKVRTISLVKLESSKWEPAPGHVNNYSIDFFMPFQKNLLGAGAKFLNAHPKIVKTGKLYLDRGILDGRIFYDKDNNCKLSSRDEILNDRLIRITPGPYYVRPNSDGRYYAFLPHGEYEVEVLNRRYWSVSSCAKEKIEIKLAEELNASGVDFPLNFKSEVEDLKIDVTSSSGWVARKGGTQLYNIRTENTGSEKIKNNNIELEFNIELNKSFKSFPAPDSIIGNRAVFNVSSMEAGQVSNIRFRMELPDTFSESSLELAVAVAPSTNESSLDDNESSLTQVITDSTYQNLKQVFPLPSQGETISQIDPDDGELKYLINFANFSQDTVRTIYVVDTIDVNLDIQYIQETGASHNYTTRVINGPPGSNIATVIWTFTDVDLVPNPNRYNDMPGYSGYIGFKVKLNSGVPLGTIIKNQAVLVFDNQHSESTNLVQTKVVELVSVPTLNLDNGSVVMYPNPSDGMVYLKPLADDLKINSEDIRVYDVQGRRVNLNKAQEGVSVVLNFSGLSEGLYLVSGATNKGFIRKTVIIR
jgi:hypothetical protein